MIIYLIIFSLQCIQMLIFICICTILIVEGFSEARFAENDEMNDQLLDNGLDEDEIEEIVSNKPNTSVKDET